MRVMLSPHLDPLPRKGEEIKTINSFTKYSKKEKYKKHA
jgi:hypothetical protein